MINPNDVDKGNYIRIIGKPEIFRVSGKQAGALPKPSVIFLLADQQGWQAPEQVEGIPLTPDVLHNLGFVEKDVATSGGKLFAFQAKDADFILDQRSTGINRWIHKPSGRDLGFVHELQNLFLALTGKELMWEPSISLLQFTEFVKTKDQAIYNIFISKVSQGQKDGLFVITLPEAESLFTGEQREKIHGYWHELIYTLK